MVVATGVLIDGPAPRPPIFTLLSAATVIPTGDDEHWEMGAEVRAYPCGPSHPWAIWGARGEDGAGNLVTTKVTITNTPMPSFDAIGVYLREECNARGLGAQAFADRVEAVFPAVASYALEREFWTGIVNPDSPHLAGAIPVPGGADSTIFPNGDTAVSVIDGVMLLEAAIATTGRQGMIHLTPAALTKLVHAGTSVQSVNRGGGAVLQTILGTILVPGGGYQTAAGIFNGSTPVPPETHPAPTGTQEWMFATTGVEVRPGTRVTVPEATEAALSQALDRGQNLLAYEVYQPYLVTWDACFKAAVLIDRAT